MIRRFFRRLWAQWVMDERPAWREPPPGLPLLDLEQVEHELAEQEQLPAACRDYGLVSFLLDMRGCMRPPADGDVLRNQERAS